MLYKVALLVSATLTLTACGGGGGGGSGGGNGGGGTPPPPPPAAQSDFERGIFNDPDLFSDICLNPRSGAGFNDTQGSATDENEWLRAWSHDLYLWYDEIVDADPEAFDTPTYFDLMQTNELTPSGARKDQFHFTFDTEAWEALSQSGVSAGYGAEFILISARPPREIVVAFVEPNSPADLAGMTRGSRVLLVDGVDAINDNTQAGVDALNAGLFPGNTGTSTRLRISDFDDSNVRDVDLVSASITQNPTPVTDVFQTPSGPVGYLLFTTHIAPAEAALVAAIESFAGAGITDLILDLRYNGGGFLDIANQISYMIAGPVTIGQTFDETQFNDKHPTINPVTGQLLGPTPFHTVTQGFPGLPAGQPLPSVDLARVFILTGPETCSASEAIINGLRGLDGLQGINFEVILIGETTCGKPYGFYPTDNCGTTYFSIQFRGINAQGFGDYADGFIPSENPVETVEVRGCEVADDYSRPLGDPTEARLSTALDYIATGQCIVPVRASPQSAAKQLNLQRSGGLALEKSGHMPGMVIRR
ncbi:MAG: S41 family peptidase [bacterium]